MTEGEERLAVQIHVSETLGHIVFILRWDLAFGSIDGVQQAPRRVSIAKEHVGNRVAALDASPPGLEDGRHVFFKPGDGQRSGVHQHYHSILIGRANRLDQIFLTAGQGQAGAVTAFGLDLIVGADIYNRHVRTPGDSGGLGDGIILT